MPQLGQYAQTEAVAPTVTRARSVSAVELSASDTRAWVALEVQALEPNAYMSPHFVLPALRHLDPSLHPQILLVERTGAGLRQTIAVAVVHRVAATRLLPVPHQCGYMSRHSYLGAPLLHREFAAEAASALLDLLGRQRWSAAGLLLPNIDPASPLMAALGGALRSRGLAIHVALERQRAIMIPAQAGLASLKKNLGKKFNDLERRRRRLAEQGELQWLIHREVVDDAMVESFLSLEHSGWKAESRTSLRSKPQDEAFFREMVAGFASEGRALFTELRLNGQTIASTSNFVSAHAGFAFKVGWDEAYRKYGLGILNETEFVSHAPDVCGDITNFDSGSAPDSYMDTLWPNRRTLVTAFVPFSTWGQGAWNCVQRLRMALRSLRSRANAGQAKAPAGEDEAGKPATAIRPGASNAGGATG